jgi:hypothetical protein
MVKYAVGLETAIAENLPHSDKAICARLKMSRGTLWEWRLDPRFCRWLSARIRTVNEQQYDLMIRRHLEQAIRGSVRSAQVIIAARALELRMAALNRGAGDDGDGGDPSTNYRVNVLVRHDPQLGVVNLLVPRPPEVSDGDYS